jgi:NAD(P)H-hydrate epimerase
MQLAVPEAMCFVEKGEDHLATISSLEKYNAIGIGPGIGMRESNIALLANIFLSCKKPMVLDADALNTLASDPTLLQKIPAQTVITPHIKEFERLFGCAANDFERMQLAIQKASALQIVIVLKGKYTLVATPGGMAFFNTTGNPGMAKAGNGDVLTGMILAFLAQGYTSGQAACFGVYLHGSAADNAITGIAMEALLPSDCINFIGAAIKKLY